MPTIEELIKTKPYKDPRERALVNIIFTGSWLVARINQLLKAYGITEPQYNVLRILRGQHGKPMSLFEIQGRMLQKMSNVSRLIDKLLEKGLVERTECKENRRMVDIRITKKGLEKLNEVEAPMDENLDVIHNNLTEEEATQLSLWLDTLRNE